MAQSKASVLTLSRLVGLYIAHAAVYYRQRHTGQPTREHLNIASAMRGLLATLPAGIEARDLKAHHVSAWMLRLATTPTQQNPRGCSRQYINACLGRLKRMLRWAQESGFLTASAIAPVLTIRPYVAHRSPAYEPPRREPADESAILAILPVVPPAAADFLELLSQTGARAGELLAATADDIKPEPGNRSGWLTVRQHKSAHKGHARSLPLRGAAWAIVTRRAAQAGPGGLLFPSRAGKPWTVGGMRGAIRKACQLAGVAKFTPHQVRHTVARRARRAAGLDAAQALLGHQSIEMTQHYAPVESALAMEAVRLIMRRPRRAS